MECLVSQLIIWLSLLEVLAQLWIHYPLFPIYLCDANFYSSEICLSALLLVNVVLI